MRFLSSKIHTVIGLIVGIGLLFAAELFGFKDVQAATSIARIIGAFIIINELITTSKLSPFKLVPMRVHLIIDYLTGAVLALSPWLLGFAGTSANHWVPHLVIGLLIIGYALVTNPADSDDKSPVT
jgi:hypothetical protein